MSRRLAIPAVLILVALALSAVVLIQYGRAMRRARERTSVGSQIVQTSHGPVEYADVGSGPPVLVAHGAGGGYDQGLDFAGALVARGYRVIAVSRFGYLRTALPADAAPEAQADAYAEVLEALHLQRVAVVGLSAGAPSCMQFALRHADQTAALILLVPAAYPSHLEQSTRGAMPKQTSGATRVLFDVALESDFALWAAARLAPGAMLRLLVGTPSEAVAKADADERARAGRVLDHLLPFGPRRLGVMNDASITPLLPRYPLERIAAPALVLSTADDLFGTYEGARYSAEHIPDARFVGYASGGHALIGHREECLFEITSFLEEASVGLGRHPPIGAR